MKAKQMKKEVAIKEGIKLEIKGNKIFAEGPKGKVERKLIGHKMNAEIKDGKVILIVKNATKKDKMMLGTMASHVRNMEKGVSLGFTYKLAICSGHFPMTVTVTGKKFGVKNFLGEKIERTFENPHDDVSIKVNGKEIIVEGPDKEKAGNIATKIEQLCRITDKDRRRFQDGIFIVEKAGKSIMHN